MVRWLMIYSSRLKQSLLRAA